MLDDLRAAFAFLTIIPVGNLPEVKPGRSFAYFPLVGLVIGIMISVVASITFLPRDVTAFVTLAVWVALTGGLHLDGLADSCDGLLSTTTPERRLEIMKDPRAGSWAVIGVVMVLLGKWAAIRNLPPAFLVIAPIVARWGMVLAVAAFPNARTLGLAARFREGFNRTQLLIASVITTILVVIFSLVIDWHLLLSLFIAPIAVLIIGRWAASRLGGGLTGDVYGALCEVIELLCLISIAG